MKKVATIFFILHIFCLQFILAGEEGDVFVIHKSAGPIEFDGIVNEPAWASAGPLPVLMYQPNHGNAPSERTEIYITYDQDYLYLAGKLYYNNGARIIATSKKRDVLPMDRGNDYLGILLDTFGDNENAYCFQTTPTGIRCDFSVFNDAREQLEMMPFNESWNTYWDVKSTVGDSIWEVEIQIPFTSLRFQSTDGVVTMGMIVWRFISSKQERIIFPIMSNELGMFSYWRPSQSMKVVFEGVIRKNPVYITPYVLGGIEQVNEINAQNTEYVQDSDLKLTGGLDLKYALTSNMTMDITANTDFAQVEVDDQMINVTRFDLFFPEKRQFFLERSSLFDFKTGFNDQMFYSRRIGLYEGNIVPIYGGLRVIGRAGKWDVGILDMQTAGIDYRDEDTDSLMYLEAANHGVARLRRQVFNPRSYLGGMVTSIADVNGGYNINAGFDGNINIKGNDYLNINYARTFENGTGADGDNFNRDKFYLAWVKRSDVGFGYEFNLSRKGKYHIILSMCRNETCNINPTLPG
jgi:hypothetical protein